MASPHRATYVRPKSQEPMTAYITISADAEATGEFEDRRSRFIAQLAHVSGEAQATAFVEKVRSRHRDARHNVPAWVLADGREKRSDDGEPQGTAGMPILDVLHGAGLKDVCCVVTRYFGGTLLGPGGLKRAYTAATQAAVAQAQASGQLVTMTLVTRVTCVIPYSAYDRVRRMVTDASGQVRDTIFAEDVQVTAIFRTGEEQAFLAAMQDFANGEDLCVVGEPVFGEF